MKTHTGKAAATCQFEEKAHTGDHDKLTVKVYENPNQKLVAVKQSEPKQKVRTENHDQPRMHFHENPIEKLNSGNQKCKNCPKTFDRFEDLNQ